MANIRKANVNGTPTFMKEPGKEAQKVGDKERRKERERPVAKSQKG